MTKILFTCVTLMIWQACDAFCPTQPNVMKVQRKHFKALIFYIRAASNEKHIGDREDKSSLPNGASTGKTYYARDKIIQKFEADISTVLKEARSGRDMTLYPQEMAESKAGLTLSHVWDLQMWQKHTSRYRYVRDVKTMFSSRLIKRIYPQLTVFVSWSLLYIYIVAKKFNRATIDMVPLTSLSLVSTFVGFLLTLRSNQGLTRLSEGRNLFGRTFIVTRDTSQLLATYVYPKDKNLGIMAARYLSLFPWLLKGGLRDSSDSDIIDIMLTEYDSSYLKSQRKKPAALNARIRQIVAELSSRDQLPVAAHQQLETNLNEMNYILVSQNLKMDQTHTSDSLLLCFISFRRECARDYEVHQYHRCIQLMLVDY